MGKITGAAHNKFKSAEYIYSKIKRQWKSFGNVNLLDDADFPAWTAEVLKQLGQSVFKEAEAILHVENGKANLPRDFMQIYAAYACSMEGVIRDHLQNKQVVYNDTYFDILSSACGCSIECTTEQEQLVQRITVRNYVQDITYKFINPTLLKLSPNIKEHCADDCLNTMCSSTNEITINNGCILTNFKDHDIYLKYYAFPFDEQGGILIPDIVEVEHAVEWYIKYQILLNFWLVDDITNAVNKWGKAEQEYEKWKAEAKFQNKLPAFSTMTNEARNQRGINKVAFFSQMDRHR